MRPPRGVVVLARQLDPFSGWRPLPFSPPDAVVTEEGEVEEPEYAAAYTCPFCTPRFLSRGRHGRAVLELAVRSERGA